MTSSFNYNNNIFEKANLPRIHGEPTFKMLHKIRKNIKAKFKSVYSNLRGGAHGHLRLVLTNTQYVFIPSTTFVYLTQSGPLIILDVTTTHSNYNMRIVHT